MAMPEPVPTARRPRGRMAARVVGMANYYTWQGLIEDVFAEWP